MNYVFAAIALVCYGWAYRQLWQHRTQLQQQKSVLWLTFAALGCHALVAHRLLFPDSEAQLSLIYVVNVIALVMAGVVCAISVRLPTDRLLLVIVPVNAVAVAAAVLIPAGAADATPLTTALLIHIILSLAAYSALMLAAAQSVLLAILERQLRHPQKTVLPWLPPLETMEQLLVAMLWVGLVLLSGAIASGFIFLEDMFAQQVAHHTVITSLSWFVFAFFLAGRYLFGWRGLTAVRWTLLGFALLVIGYLGSKFVLEYILIR